jgi:hypothetical protein
MTTWQEQFKKTLVPTQVAIGAVAVGLGAWTRSAGVAFVFLVAMEAGALLGALWGARLKRKLDRMA